MPLFIQTITITWTKASRGGELATLRARVPKQHPVKLKPDSQDHHWHALAYSEKNRFAAPIQDDLGSLSLDEPFQFASIEIACSGDAAILTCRYQDGAPARAHHDHTGTLVPEQHTLHIPPDSWAYLEYNRRLTDFDTGNWWYEHFIVSVAVGPKINPQNPFPDPPARHLPLLSRLR
jgi:hypothetical protein